MTKGELKDIIRECYEELLAEDKSDIAEKYARDRFIQKQVSNNDRGNKVPRYHQNMTDNEKENLRYHDHEDGESLRGRAGRNGKPQTAELKSKSDAINNKWAHDWDH